MKLKELIAQYGEYELYTDSPKHIEDAFKNLGSKDDGVLCLYVKKRKPKTVWDLEIREIYYDLHSDGQIHPLRYEGKESDEKRILTGSAFITKEEAEQDLERRRVETLLLKHGGRRWYKDESDTDKSLNWHIFCGFDVSVGWGGPRQGTIYFDTKEQAEKAIAEIGEERLKKALFEVRE